MRPSRILLAVFLLSLLPAQDTNQPYFSLSTGKTFAPGDKPSVQLWSQNVDSLEFRVYKVRDPILFFQKLEDVHRFGAAPPPRRPGERTALERFHRWKLRARTAIRGTLRAQYTADSRQTLRAWAASRDGKPVPPITTYPGVPLLNPQQVVSVWRQPAGRGQRWESEAVPIPVSDKGLYLVEAASETLRAYTVVIVTDLAILTKTAPGRLLSFVTDRTTRAPVAGLDLLVWSNKKEIARARTGASGLAETKIDEADPDSTMVLARRGEDFAIDSLGGWNLSVDPDRYTTGYVYTDRPVYRPGHTVHWKAILRQQIGSTYRIPAARQVSVEILDPESKPVSRGDAAVSPAGAIHGDLALPEAAALGYYSIQIHVGEGEVGGGFHVEEYRKPEYEVRVTLDKPRVLQGASVEAGVSARYFYGEPVARANVKYVVHRMRYWNPYYIEDDEFGDEERGEGFYGGEQVSEQSGQLDADGKLTVSIPTEVSDQKWDMRYRIEARVTDAGNREIAGAASVVATHGSFLVRVQGDQYVYEPGQSAAFTVETRDYDGNPVQAPVQLELAEHEWGRSGEKVVERKEARTDAAGRAKVSFTLARGGSYFVRAAARTPEGRQVESRAYAWVSGAAGAWGGQAGRIQIVADKKSYRPGDVAKVLVVAGAPGAHVLVTAEGRELYTKQVIRAEGATFTVDIPVRAEYAPNFFVNAAFVNDGKLVTGSKSVAVPAVEQQLSIEIAASRPEFKPGEPGVYTVTARDSNGRPVSAELSLGVVDEAVYSVRPDTTQDIFKFFYGRTYNRIGTSSSLSYYFHGEAGKRLMQLTRVRNPSLAQLKPEALVQPRIRRAFPDTALWLANVRTGSSGRAVAKLDFPDALTTWRATARAITPDTKAGSAIHKVIARKNLMTRLVTPRFFTSGDEATVSVLTHNYLKTEKAARVWLEAKGIEILEGAARDVKIPVGGEAKVDWRVRATATGDVVLTAKALTDEESDAMELTLPVIPYGVKLSESRAGAMPGPSGTQDIELAVPASAVAESRKLILSMTPSIAGTIFGALEYLTSFPYGCTEQTMSSFLPNVIVSQAVKELRLKTRIDPAALEKKVRAGLDRLYDFQHEDGGWGWWKDDPSHPFMTAYVAAGLAQAKSAGYEVRADSIERGAAWLRTRLASGSELPPDSHAYAVYALSQAGPDARPQLDAAWRQRAKMSAYGVALLGLALQSAQDPRAAEAAGMLEAQAESGGQEASWPVKRDDMLDFPGDATPESTAFAVKFLAAARPASPLLPKAALWLVNHRDQGYYWLSTKQTAMVVYGLTPYLKSSGELRPNFAVAVAVNGKQVASQRFTEADGVAPGAVAVRIPAAAMNHIQIVKTGEGRLYWSARAEYFTAEDNLQRTGSTELRLARDYYKLVPVSEGGKIVHQLEPLSGELHPGDVLVARLTLTGGSWRYLLIEDPIPAGAEFIEKDDLYEIRNRPPWWRYTYSRREFHDNRAAIFQEYFNGKEIRHLYLLKIVNPGRFKVSPATAQPMYQPQYLSTTESKLVEVR